MRVRPFFWVILALCCISVVVMATVIHQSVAPIQLHLSIDQQHPQVAQSSTVTLHLTDTQGIPIDNASTTSTINMIQMDMGEIHPHFQSQGKGTYSTTIQWSMAGPWSMMVHVNAPGFQTGTSLLYVTVCLRASTIIKSILSSAIS